MGTTESAWLKESCKDSNKEISSNNSLGLEIFWGLFLIEVIASPKVPLFWQEIQDTTSSSCRRCLFA